MKDEALRKLACDLSNKIYVHNAPNCETIKLNNNTSDLLYEALKLVDNQNAEARLECLTIVSRFMNSPSLRPMMSGERMSYQKIGELLQKMYDLLNINLPELKNEY